MPQMALKVREPYCGLLANGIKTAEIRSTQLPLKYQGEPVALLQCRERVNSVIGIAVFSHSVPVGAEWLRGNVALHCIPACYLDEMLTATKQQHAWHVSRVRKFKFPLAHRSSSSVTWEKLKVDAENLSKHSARYVKTRCPSL